MCKKLREKLFGKKIDTKSGNQSFKETEKIDETFAQVNRLLNHYVDDERIQDKIKALRKELVKFESGEYDGLIAEDNKKGRHQRELILDVISSTVANFGDVLDKDAKNADVEMNALVRRLTSLVRDFHRGRSFYATSFGRDADKAWKEMWEHYIRNLNIQKEIMDAKDDIKYYQEKIDQCETPDEAKKYAMDIKRLKNIIDNKEKQQRIIEDDLAKLQYLTDKYEIMSSIEYVNENQYAEALQQCAKQYEIQVDAYKLANEMAMQAVDRIEEHESDLFEEESFTDKIYNKNKRTEESKDSHLDEDLNGKEKVDENWREKMKNGEI